MPEFIPEPFAGSTQLCESCKAQGEQLFGADGRCLNCGALIDVPALLAVGERDRQQIARLTEALEAALDRLVHVNGNTLLTIYEAQQIIRAVLADEEDAANG